MEEDFKAQFYEKERMSTVKSSVFFLVCAIFLGFPLWWYTTTVYRANLPTEKIDYFLSPHSTLEVLININVYYGEHLTEQIAQSENGEGMSSSGEFASQLTSLLEYELAMAMGSSSSHSGASSNGGSSKIKYVYKVNHVESDDAGSEHVDNGQGKDEIEDGGGLRIVFDLLDEDNEATLEDGQLFHSEIDPFSKTVYFYLGDVDCNLEDLVGKAASVIREQLVAESAITREYMDNLISRETYQTQPDTAAKAESDTKTWAKPSTEKLHSCQNEYDVVFTLINPQPEVFNSKLVKWNIQEAISKYLIAHLNTLKHVAKFRINSQIVYQVKLGAQPRQQKSTTQDVADDSDSGSGENVDWVLSEIDIPHLITPVERKIGFTFSNSSVINLVTYMAPVENSPLHFVNQQAHFKYLTYYKAWGAVLLYNAAAAAQQPKNNTKTDEPNSAEINIDVQRQMAAFIPIINAMLGVEPLRNQIHNSSLVYSNYPFNASTAVSYQRKEKLDDRSFLSISNLQLDVLYRRRIVKNVGNAIATIKSLISLCDYVRNMIIRDEIGDSVERSIVHIENTLRILSNGGSLVDALSQSYIANELAEKAFSDPTILAMLYFPEDQKYAIYVPMFVPMSLPLWSSVGILAGYWKTRKNSNTPVD